MTDSMEGRTTSALDNRSFLDDFRSFDKGGFFDLGHPLLNRITESFVKAAGVSLSLPLFYYYYYLSPPLS